MEFRHLTAKACPICGCETLRSYRLEDVALDTMEPQDQEVVGFSCGVIAATDGGDTTFFGQCTRNPSGAEDALAEKKLVDAMIRLVEESDCNVVTKGNLLQTLPMIQ